MTRCNYMRLNYLAHHGIKGQKWGVRNGPPYPLSEQSKTSPERKQPAYSRGTIKGDIAKTDVTITRGFKFNRVGQNEKDANASGALYVSYGTNDAYRYIRTIGPTPLGRVMDRLGGIKTAEYQQTIVATKDLKVPSQKNTSSIIANKLINDDALRKTVSDSLWTRLFYKYDNGEITKEACEKMLKDPQSEQAKQLLYSVYKNLGDVNYKEAATSIYDAFRRNGYDAIPDFNDRMSGISESATIIINPDKVRVESARYLSKDIMKEAKDFVKGLANLPVDEALGL